MPSSILTGDTYVRLAVQLGVKRDRIDTIIDYEPAKQFGVKTEASADASTPEVLSEMAALIASRIVTIPIAKAYSLDHVRDAYEELEGRHTHGKIVLIP